MGKVITLVISLSINQTWKAGTGLKLWSDLYYLLLTIDRGVE